MIPSGLSISPKALLWLVPAALALAALGVWGYRRIAPSMKASTRTLLTALRVAALVIVACLLARPLLSLAGGGAGKGIVVVLTDVSRSMDLPADSTGGAKARTRAAVAEAAAKNAARELGGRYRVVERKFAAGAVPPTMPDSSLGSLRERTAPGDALAQAVAGLDAVRGIVVVSDGAVTSGRDPVRAARELGVPVATVAVGEMPGADVAVLDVLANPTARVGEDTPVEVRLRALGPPRSVRLEIAEGATVVAHEDVALPGGGAEIVKRVTYRPARPGLSVFEARVGAAEGEWSAVDNRRAYAQEILPDKQKVLVVAGSYHWDWAWARRAVATDSAYAADHRVFARGRFEKAAGAGTDAALPGTVGALRPYALCVLVGVEEGQIPAGASRALADYVQGGGSLVAIGGGARAGLLALAGSPLGDALRIARAPGLPALSEATIALTAEGRESDVLRVDDDPAASAEAWAAFAPLANLQPLGVSAEDPVLATDANGRFPVVIERRVGRGHVLLVNGSGLYRWGFSGGDALAPARFERLWGNILRSLSEPAQTEPLRLVPEHALVSRGEPVTLEAALQDATFQPVDGARIAARMSGPVNRDVVLEGTGNGGYRTTVEGLPPGRYAVSARAEKAGRAAGTAGATFWIDAQSAEWQDVAPDPGALAAIARASGGIALTPGHERQIAPALSKAVPKASREASVRLWESPVVFALLAFFLTTEWWVRRRRGLA